MKFSKGYTVGKKKILAASFISETAEAPKVNPNCKSFLENLQYEKICKYRTISLTLKSLLPNITFFFFFTPVKLEGQSRPIQVLVSAKCWKSKDSLQLGSRDKVRNGCFLSLDISLFFQEVGNTCWTRAGENSALWFYDAWGEDENTPVRKCKTKRTK